MRDPHKYYDDIDLHPGDIVIESSTGCVGFLVKRLRHIDMVFDDIYFWHITWSDPAQIPNFNIFSQSDHLEEMYLKNMIITGIIIWQSVNGGTFEL
tara:strand:+ start:369 stop:656 length:288 start_codon:yes stop_codon:yes gene_type:complete